MVPVPTSQTEKAYDSECEVEYTEDSCVNSGEYLRTPLSTALALPNKS